MEGLGDLVSLNLITRKQERKRARRAEQAGDYGGSGARSSNDPPPAGGSGDSGAGSSNDPPPAGWWEDIPPWAYAAMFGSGDDDDDDDENIVWTPGVGELVLGMYLCEF